MTVSLNLNNLIRTRLVEVAEAAWRDHRIMPIGDSDGRVLELGSAATRERWVCGADHGHGPCNEPLLTHRQAAELLGLLNEDEPVLDPQLPVTDVELLDEQVGGFTCGSLFHWSDIRTEFQKAQG
ncbi:hypothetical protein ACWDA7_13955 [Streptomyces sp. NPDC001156]